jgi:FKBP-type peptidyl-prolyl cis-trans isomerase
MLRRATTVAVLAFGLFATAGCSKGDDPFAIPADAIKSPTGLTSKMLRVGLGSVHPTPQSSVTVHYTLWTTDGKQWESSVASGKPATFRLDQVIKGWTEGLQLMVVGEKRRFWVPANLGYGDSGPPDEPHGTLIFDIELLDVR